MQRGRDKFKKYKGIINIICAFYSIFPKKIQNKLLILNRRKTGYFGLIKRYCLLKKLAKKIGDNVSIHPDVYLFNVQNLIIGDNVSIHPMSYIEAYGGVEIGNDVSIAHGVTIMSVNHGYSDINVPIKEQQVEARPIVIKDNVWIGAKATILGNTVISNGTIVGAGAVVTKNVEKNKIVAGVPAKAIKSRD